MFGAVDAAKAVITGTAEYATKEQQQARIEACKACDKLKPALFVCGACGCYLPAKVKFALSRCPLNKW